MKNLFKKLSACLMASKSYKFDLLQDNNPIGFSSRGADVTINHKPPSVPPKARRHFEFERKQYPWLQRSDYENLGRQGMQNVRLAPWGREYTDHAISSTLPSMTRYNKKDNTTDPSIKLQNKYRDEDEYRSVMPYVVERTICYGQSQVDKSGKITYILGDVEVGITSDEKKVYHIKYTHE
jgi:hypothetical protein